MRIEAIVLVPVLLVACGSPPPAKPTLEEEARRVNEVFEAAEPYSPRTIDSAAIEGFLADHPEFLADTTDIRAFYLRRGRQYAWFVHDTLSSAAGEFLQLIGATDTTVMPAEGADDWHWLVTSVLDTTPMTDSSRLATELLLTSRFFRLAHKQYGGFVQRDLRELDWYIPRRKKNVGMLLDSLVAGRSDLSSIEPVHPQYRKLKQRIERYHDMLDMGPWPEVVPWALPRGALGDTLAGLDDLRERLFLLGDLDSAGCDLPVDSALIRGLLRFQMRHGIGATGRMDAATAAAMNVPLEDRLRTLLVNMERLRWVPDEQAPDQILVNVPEFRMHVFEDGREAWAMNVVVGAEATRTVIFSNALSSIVFAPYWNIPQSIVRGEILPAVKRNRGYLDRKNMEVLIGDKVVPASSIDWSKYTTGVPFTIRQKPGPGNALGQVKFLFPNAYSIYFHDTPAKDKFNYDRRAFSHGCIRLGEPAKLAGYLLRNDSTWNAAAIAKAMNGSTEVNVSVDPPRPVAIVYFTAWVDEEGRLNFRDDVYGHDAALARELFAGDPGSAKLAAR